MIRVRQFRLMPVMFAGLMLCLGAFAQSLDEIDISKMNPAGLLVDKYSYMSQPYNFYYFHHMDCLGLRTDWIKKGNRPYPLREPTKEWTIEYAFQGSRYFLDDYFKRNFVTGFLVLHNDQIIIEKYFHEADQNSRFVSQSLSKSIISILMGAAVEEGAIKSIEDPVAKYLPYLSTSGYRDVTVKNLLQMSSGVNYSEYNLNERITLEEAIQVCTMGGAFAARREKTEGSIEVGKLADVIIISQDLFKIAPNQIGKTKVMMTMVGGKVVYQDPSWGGEKAFGSK